MELGIVEWLGLVLTVAVSDLGSGDRKTKINRREYPRIVYKVTGQLADKPTRGQSSRGLVNSRTSQLAGMFDLKFGVYMLLLILERSI